MPNPIKHTSQAIDNWSFDASYEQAAIEILTENLEGTALIRQKEIVDFNFHGIKNNAGYDYFAFKQQGGDRYKILKLSETDDSDANWATGTDFATDWPNYTTLTYGII